MVISWDVKHFLSRVWISGCESSKGAFLPLPFPAISALSSPAFPQPKMLRSGVPNDDVVVRLQV